MVVHLSLKEKDLVLKWSGKGLQPIEVHKKLVHHRAHHKIDGEIHDAPNLTNVRKFLKGKTHSQGKPETRGRKRTYTRRNVLTMNAKRKQLIQKADGDYEVKWCDVQKKSRVPKAHPSTAARAFQAESVPVAAHPPREKPERDAEQERERYDICARWRRYPAAYWHKLHLIIDNKRWEAPTTGRSRNYLRKQKVRFHLRTRAEGLKKGFTKPNQKRHRINPGGSLNVCAGIANNKVVLWEYLGKRWCGETAADLYKGPIAKVLRKHHGEKSKYRILEDNDPAGYKSSKGKSAKKAVGIAPIEFPKYSPDLNPMDFWLWNDIEKRMFANAPTGRETIKAFKKRLRLTALRTSSAAIEKAVGNIKVRAGAIYNENGGNISLD